MAGDTQIQENKRRPDGAFVLLYTLDYTLCKKNLPLPEIKRMEDMLNKAMSYTDKLGP
jgi:hypothetical protein